MYQISWNNQNPNLLENNPKTIKNNINSQIKNRKEVQVYGITNTKIKQNY